jgi:copper chaperone CopZ
MGPSLDTQTILSQLSSLNAKVVSVQGDTATIKTSLGNVTTSLSNIDAKIVSLQGDVATVTTNLGTLSGTVTSVNNGVATIQTDLGTLTVSDQGVKNSSDTTGNYALAALALSIIGLIILLVVAVQVFRKPK